MSRVAYWIGFALVCLIIFIFASAYYATSRRVTPLIVAVEADDLEKVRSLVANGANVNEKPKGIFEMPPLSVAIHNNATNSLDFLLQHGADVNLTDSLGRTPLIWAIIRGGDSNTNLILRLLELGANVNQRDKNGSSPLRCAQTITLASNSTLQVVAILKRAGAQD